MPGMGLADANIGAAIRAGGAHGALSEGLKSFCAKELIQSARAKLAIRASSLVPIESKTEIDAVL